MMTYSTMEEARRALDEGKEVFARYSCDGGCIRLCLDGRGEILVPNGYGDGRFYVSVFKGGWEEIRTAVSVVAETSLEVADYDYGEAYPVLTLPSGKYDIKVPGNGSVIIVKLS